MADHSTIFLDEIGDLSLDVQVKLLRVLEERQFERLGSPRPIRVDARIVAATHRDLDAEVRGGRFRQDLLFRIGGFTLVIPPLRDRAGEILSLADRILVMFAGRIVGEVPAGRADERTLGLMMAGAGVA